MQPPHAESTHCGGEAVRTPPRKTRESQKKSSQFAVFFFVVLCASGGSSVSPHFSIETVRDFAKSSPKQLRSYGLGDASAFGSGMRKITSFGSLGRGSTGSIEQEAAEATEISVNSVPSCSNPARHVGQEDNLRRLDPQPARRRSDSPLRL